MTADQLDEKTAEAIKVANGRLFDLLSALKEELGDSVCNDLSQRFVSTRTYFERTGLEHYLLRDFRELLEMYPLRAQWESGDLSQMHLEVAFRSRDDERAQYALLAERFEAKYLEAPRKRRCRLTVEIRDHFDFVIDTGNLTTEKARGELLKAAIREYRNRTGDGSERIRFDLVDFHKDDFELSVGSDDKNPCEAEVLHLKVDESTCRNYVDGFEPHPWEREYRIPPTEQERESETDNGLLYDHASYLADNLLPTEPGGAIEIDERKGAALRYVREHFGGEYDVIRALLKMFPYRAQWVDGDLDEMRHEYIEQLHRSWDAARELIDID